MTAKQTTSPGRKGDVSALQTSRCTHQAIIPGLDHVQCKNCRRCWPHWHPDYERLLIQPSIVAPEQKTVLEQKDLRSVKSAPEQIHWIEIYSPSLRKDYSYYRYIWMEGRKLRHVHIPGGNTKSAMAIAHKQEVERAIAAGWWPSEIEELIKSWRQK